jgi:CheY-like chemotaxis protein
VSERASVLVADDEPGIRFVLRETLEEAGHTVTEAVSGDEALAALAGGEFQVAFLDLRMPGPSGLDLLDHVKASGARGRGDRRRRTRSNAVEAMQRSA